MKVGGPVTGSAGPAVGGATTGGATTTVVVVGATVVVVGATVVVVVVGATFNPIPRLVECYCGGAEITAKIREPATA